MNAHVVTHVACLTPVGTGAIAVLAIHGPGGWSVTRELFRPASGRPLPEAMVEPGTVWFGRIGDGGIADEVVLSVKQVEPAIWLELHTHGGRQVVDWLLELLSEKGLARCSWERFLRLVDSVEDADAWEQLARASTVRTATILLDQAQGALRFQFKAIHEAALAGKFDEALGSVDQLLRQSRLGMHLVAPWVVVVAGPPNVGKSSLVNALAGFQRSIVAPVAGTTRDVVSTNTAIDGWPVELRDTAGLRDPATDLESAGIDLARAALESADLVLWVHDATELPRADSAVLNRHVGPDHLTILNKCDLVETTSMVDADVRISARTGAGLPELCTAISRKLVPSSPNPGTGIPYLPSQIAALDKIRLALIAENRGGVGELFAAVGK